MEKICPFCEESFDANEIKTHIGIQHLGIPLKEIKVENITETKDDKAVIDHEEKPKQQKEFKCQHCLKVFHQKCNLTEHINANHYHVL